MAIDCLLHQVCGPKGCSSSCIVRRRTAHQGLHVRAAGEVFPHAEAAGGRLCTEADAHTRGGMERGLDGIAPRLLIASNGLRVPLMASDCIYLFSLVPYCLYLLLSASTCL